MSWYLIEYLTEEFPLAEFSTAAHSTHATLIAKDGVSKDWLSLDRIERDTGIKASQIFELAKPNSEVLINGRRGQRRVRISPVFSVDNTIYALRIWVGEVDVEPTPQRIVSAVKFDVATLNIHMTEDLFMMSSLTMDDFADSRSPDKFFHKVFDAADMAGMVEMALSPEPGKHSGSVSLVHDDGHLMLWKTHSRNCVGVDGDETHALVHDVTDTEPPDAGPSAAFKISQPERADAPMNQMVLTINPPHPPIVTHWQTARPAWLGYAELGRISVFHEDSWESFYSAAQTLAQAGERTEIWIDDLQAWMATGRWEPVRIGIRRYPGLGPGHLLHLASLIRVTD